MTDSARRCQAVPSCDRRWHRWCQAVPESLTVSYGARRRHMVPGAIRLWHQGVIRRVTSGRRRNSCKTVTDCATRCRPVEDGAKRRQTLPGAARRRHAVAHGGRRHRTVEDGGRRCLKEPRGPVDDRRCRRAPGGRLRVAQRARRRHQVADGGKQGLPVADRGTRCQRVAGGARWCKTVQKRQRGSRRGQKHGLHNPTWQS